MAQCAALAVEEAQAGDPGKRGGCLPSRATDAVCIQALGAGDDPVASNKKIVVEGERKIRLCET